MFILHTQVTQGGSGHNIILQTHTFLDVCYRPQRSRGKVMFSQACVILFTGGWGLPQCMLGYHPLPPRAGTPPRSRPLRLPGPGTPRRRACSEIRSTRGRYESYWNAILFIFKSTCDYFKRQYINNVGGFPCMRSVFIKPVSSKLMPIKSHSPQRIIIIIPDMMLSNLLFES